MRALLNKPRFLYSVIPAYAGMTNLVFIQQQSPPKKEVKVSYFINSGVANAP